MDDGRRSQTEHVSSPGGRLLTHANIFRYRRSQFSQANLDHHVRSERRGYREYRVQFPSAAPSGVERNDRVHLDFFEPTTPPPYPLALYLHGWKVNRPLPQRHLCKALAKSGFGTMLMTLPYHGERTPRGERGGERGGERFLHIGLGALLRTFHQAVVDARRSIDWARWSPRVANDAAPVLLLGESMGSIFANIVGGVDHRIGRLVLLISGGNLIRIVARGRFLHPLRNSLAEHGYGPDQYSRDALRFDAHLERLGLAPPPALRADWPPSAADPDGTHGVQLSRHAPGRGPVSVGNRTGIALRRSFFHADPLSHAPTNRQRPCLMVNARYDLVIPSQCTLELWVALGRPPIRWLHSHHSTLMLRLRTLSSAICGFATAPLDGDDARTNHRGVLTGASVE